MKFKNVELYWWDTMQFQDPCGLDLMNGLIKKKNNE